MNICKPDTTQRITSLVAAYGSLPTVDASGRRILKLLQADKKTIGGVPHFVLPVEVGRVEVVNNVPEKVVTEAVHEITRLSGTQ